MLRAVDDIIRKGAVIKRSLHLGQKRDELNDRTPKVKGLLRQMLVC